MPDTFELSVGDSSDKPGIMLKAETVGDVSDQAEPEPEEQAGDVSYRREGEPHASRKGKGHTRAANRPRRSLA